jgi:hypothetical protein
MIENHILASYYQNRMDDIRSKVNAIASAMGLTSGFIPIPTAIQVPLIDFRYVQKGGDNNPAYLWTKKALPHFDAQCFGGFIVLEQNFNAFSRIDPDTYEPVSPPVRIPATHEMFCRGDILIYDNGVYGDDRKECENKYKIGKPYKEQTLPFWIRPHPTTPEFARLTELTTDPESASPPEEAITREYYLELHITQQEFEDTTPIRDLSKFISSGGKSLLKVDEVLNGILLVSPACFSRKYGPTPFAPVPPTQLCDIKALLQSTIKNLY